MKREERSRSAQQKCWRKDRKITKTVYLNGKDETHFQKLFSVEKKKGFDDCQAPQEEDRNDKPSRKQHRPRLAEAEGSEENVAHRYCLVCLNCKHAQLQQGKRYPPRDTQFEKHQRVIIWRQSGEANEILYKLNSWSKIFSLQNCFPVEDQLLTKHISKTNEMQSNSLLPIKFLLVIVPRVSLPTISE